MSKAFVNDDAPPEEVIIQRRDLTDGAANHMTVQGYEGLKTELEETRRRLTDMTQNSPGRVDEIRVLDQRAREISAILDSANVIDPTKQSGDRVLFGATVTVLDDNDEERVYRIVGVDETDAARRKVSWISPIAKTLLQARVGDEVTLQTPSKSEILEVVKIEFKPV